MSNRHKWADVIHAWADGEEIQMNYYGRWVPVGEQPQWLEHNEYRIKPEHKPDIRARLWSNDSTNFHLVFVFDGETKAFKTVEFHDE